ncbi:MAG TPA: DUF1329 domain-containing protein [Nitrosospira sp.]|jgi:hypothetical protein|nr:DUF1329 domain-containing protein [Nitrosospira sp.]
MVEHKTILAAIAILSLAIARTAVAAVSIEEASRLKSDLTPLGAEKSGNKEGSIPAWNGGYTQVLPGYQSGQPRADPFAEEKPLFQITSQNAAQYADKLSAGVKALLQRYPSYRLDVYPTHRTAAAPQWVYDNTFKNATRATTMKQGLAVEKVYGGIPFPIPKDAYEVMWNHQLAWRGESVDYDFTSHIVIRGNSALTTEGTLEVQYPYYYREGAIDNFGGVYFFAKLITTGPPLKAGERVFSVEPVDQIGEGRKVWQYLVGQRRMRRAPNIQYDTPSFVTSGLSFVDEVTLFNGAMDRYHWKLVGKKEMFVPYNTHQFHTKKIAQILGTDHVNPDHVRWELHRVWEVEATLAPGKRHALPTRRFYLDEDSWMVLLADGWDARNELWHTGSVFPLIVPELPAVVSPTYVIYDLFKNGYVASSLFNDEQRHYQIMPRRPESDYSPATVAAEGVR